MMDDRLRLFLVATRKLLIEFVATIEDYLGVPYDKSGLAKRRQKVDQHG
jgi:hypothetical protein